MEPVTRPTPTELIEAPPGGDAVETTLRPVAGCERRLAAAMDDEGDTGSAVVEPRAWGWSSIYTMACRDPIPPLIQQRHDDDRLGSMYDRDRHEYIGQDGIHFDT